MTVLKLGQERDYGIRFLMYTMFIITLKKYIPVYISPNKYLMIHCFIAPDATVHLMDLFTFMNFRPICSQTETINMGVGGDVAVRCISINHATRAKGLNPGLVRPESSHIMIGSYSTH